MTFIQTISFRTSRMDEMQKLMDAFDDEPQFVRASSGLGS